MDGSLCKEINQEYLVSVIVAGNHSNGGHPIHVISNVVPTKEIIIKRSAGMSVKLHLNFYYLTSADRVRAAIKAGHYLYVSVPLTVKGGEIFFGKQYTKSKDGKFYGKTEEYHYLGHHAIYCDSLAANGDLICHNSWGENNNPKVTLSFENCSYVVYFVIAQLYASPKALHDKIHPPNPNHVLAHSEKKYYCDGVDCDTIMSGKLYPKPQGFSPWLLVILVVVLAILLM